MRAGQGRWASTASASTRRSKTRAISTGPTRIGLLVWEEMPSAYRFTRAVGRAALARMDGGDRAATTAIRAIVAWVPINESWGVPNLPDNAARTALRPGALPPDEDARSDAAGHRQRRLGERRHRHHRHPRLRRRSRADRQALPRRRRAAAAVQARAAGRTAAGARRSQHHADMPLMLTEFGGIALVARTPKAWGYSRASTPRRLRAALRNAPRRWCANLACCSAGFCYTQFADTYQEANGLLYADRTPKIPIATDRRGDTRGAAAARSRRSRATAEPRWIERRKPSDAQAALRKPDGRALLLYARRARRRRHRRASRRARPRRAPNPHLRWHPLRGEWVAYATPSAEPHVPAAARLQPARADAQTRAPDRGAGRRLGCRGVREPVPDAWRMTAHDPPALTVPTAPGARRVRSGGVHAGSGSDARDAAALAPRAADRGLGRSLRASSAPCRRSQYVYPFENRGVEVGVTLHHPHGQIYAYPFVPPVPARALEQQRAHYETARPRPGRRLRRARSSAGRPDALRRPARRRRSCRSARATRTKSGSRRSAPRRHLRRSPPTSARDFARALKTVLLKFDGLWQHALPVHPRVPSGADRRRSRIRRRICTPSSIPAYRDARPVEVSRRQRDRRGRVYRRHGPGREGRRTAGRRRSTSMPDVVAEAPGRVNLIGEHTDYHEGFVLPTLIPQRTRVRVTARSDRRVRATSRQIGPDVAEFIIGGEGVTHTWIDYVQGVTYALRISRRLCRASICTSSPMCRLAAGCRRAPRSKSHLVRALRQLLDLLARRRRAGADRTTRGDGICRRAGRIMDQMACSLGAPREALFLDTRTLSYRTHTASAIAPNSW